MQSPPCIVSCTYTWSRYTDLSRDMLIVKRFELRVYGFRVLQNKYSIVSSLQCRHANSTELPLRLYLSSSSSSSPSSPSGPFSHPPSFLSSSYSSPLLLISPLFIIILISIIIIIIIIFVLFLLSRIFSPSSLLHHSSSSSQGSSQLACINEWLLQTMVMFKQYAYAVCFIYQYSSAT